MKKLRLNFLVGSMLFILLLVSACSQKTEELKEQIIDDKYGTCYEVLLYSFNDSNGDGIGDLQGLISQLDYIQDLGATSIWLLPFNQSTTYHKYDVVDYYAIDPEYGTMKDFEELISACEDRNIDLIMDLVINHTSAQNEWFIQATDYIRGLKEGENPDYSVCPYAEYYHFQQSDRSPSGWSKVSGRSDWYYECVFWDQMPDLNFDCQAVRTEIEDMAAFWISKGVKGFRLDAAKHYYESNSVKNIEVLSWFYDSVEAIDPNIYVVAEVWDSYHTIQEYYKSGIDSLFNFVLGDSSGQFTKTVNRLGNGKAGVSLAGNLVSMQSTFEEINPNYIDAVFLSNHDMARAAGYFSKKSDKVKLAAGLELLSTGCVFVYYGDELGMSGAGDDVNKRAPMYWTTDSSAEGMADGPPGMKEQEHQFGSLIEQKDDPLSIYNYYKKAILLRNMYPQIGRGTMAVMEDVTAEDGNICAISKTYENEVVYLLYNINDVATTVTVSKDLYTYKTMVDFLCTGEEEPVQDGEMLTIPAYGCVVLE